jgi:hypothetical protein
MKHSHGFIHANFYKMFLRNKLNAIWVDDKKFDFKSLIKNTIIICADMASENIEYHPQFYYIGHNMHNNKKFNEFKKSYPEKVLDWRFYTQDANGILDFEGSIAKYDPVNRTLSQPYGTPISQFEWANPNRCNENKKKKTKEFWFGSVWNNTLNQGNSNEIKQYIEVLKNYGIKFKAINLKHIAKLRLADTVENYFSTISPISASIHGFEQINNDYYACRLFKSVSFGKIPMSNRKKDLVFGEYSISNLSIQKLVEDFMKLNKNEELEIRFESQRKLKLYTYEKSLERFLRCVNDRW